MSETISDASTATTAATTEAPAAAQEAAPAAAPAADTAAAPAADQIPESGSLLDADEAPAPEGKQVEQKLPDTLGAPESYDYKDVQLDEGTTLDPASIDAFNTVAKELNLSQKAAAQIVGKMTPALAQAQKIQVQNLRSQWSKEVLADAGINWKANSAAINQTYKNLTSPELRRIFKASGLDCHPEVVRMMAKVARMTSQDSFEKGSAGSRSEFSAKQFYNRSNMND